MIDSFTAETNESVTADASSSATPVMTPATPSESAPSNQGLTAMEFRKKMHEAMLSELFTDLTIGCNGDEFKVHKFIVAMRSETPEEMCRDAEEENDVSFIDMSEEEDACAIESLVSFCYTGDYNEGLNTSYSEIPLSARMFRVADRYNLPSLAALAVTEFEQSCIKAFAFDVLDKTCAPSGLKVAARGIYEMTPGTDHILRATVIKRFKLRLRGFVSGDYGKDCLQSLLQSTPEFFHDPVISIGADATWGASLILEGN